MNDSKLKSTGPAAIPLLVLLFTSGVGVVLTLLRIQWRHDWHYMFLIWNLFLAWLPMLFAVEVFRRHRRGDRPGWKMFSLAGLWLLFLPNAPYIFTDVVHLTRRFLPHFWVDLSLVLLAALTGFLLGFVSLFLMQSVVNDRSGRTAGWLFVVTATGLSGFGIYLGRFLRWNSWDLLAHPLNVTQDIGHLAVDQKSLVFAALFGTFLLMGYLMLYALTHLRMTPMERVPQA